MKSRTGHSLKYSAAEIWWREIILHILGELSTWEGILLS